MVLASSNEDSIVLDPFSGSGTTIRVCQQLKRDCIAIELNPEYVNLTKERLSNSFNGFDSIDPRMEKIPNDLNDDSLRKEYLENHTKWFLKNHENALDDFDKEVERKYGKRNRNAIIQQDLFKQ